MWYEVRTFQATPCNGKRPQLFRATYVIDELPDRFWRCALVPGTLERLTDLAVVEVDPVVDVPLVAAAVALAPSS